MRTLPTNEALNACARCGIPYTEHAEAFGLAAGHVNNCAVANGFAAVSCGMCNGTCPGVHAFEGYPLDAFRGPYTFLSNFYIAQVHIFGWTFPSTEHAFQAMKSATPALDWPRFIEPRLPPGEAKRLGRTLVLRADWERVKVDFMRALVTDKFTRHADLAQKLRQTGTAVLTEGNTWHDNTWGDCRCGRAACAMPGENLLGHILMQVRAPLLRSPAPYAPPPAPCEDIPF